MVEAGRQNISMDDASATSTRDLLQERADLKREIQRQRDRIKDLERQLQHSSQSEIVSFITDNPGTTTPDIIQDVADSVPARVASHLDALEGKVVEQRSDGYYPLETES
jgi:predicted phage-related endonuclease